MSNNDWKTIVLNYSDEELKRIHRVHFKEPQVKEDTGSLERDTCQEIKDLCNSIKRHHPSLGHVYSF